MTSRIATTIHVDQYEWNPVPPTLTTAQAALGTDRSAATVEALTSTGIAIIEVPNGQPAMHFRFRTEADGDANTIELYAMRGENDHYQKVAILTITGGTQVDGDVGVFCDTVAISANTEVWPTALAASPTTGANGIALFSLNTHGYKKFLFIATTKAGASFQIDKANG